MHALDIVQQLIRSCSPGVHAARVAAIMAAVAAAVRGRRLTLTEIGRALVSPTDAKHSIKRINRLLGNRHLATERFELYRVIAHRALGGTRAPLIIVYWSDLTADRRCQLLRAALPIGGRALTLYEEVHPLRYLANPHVHRAFLRRLHELLPPGARPILLTDAGFRAPWFNAVNRMNWNWIGRIRNRDFLRPWIAQQWVGCETLYAHASRHPQAMGCYQIVRSNPVLCHLFLIRRLKKHRIHKTIHGQRSRCNQSMKQAGAQREPWLLAASPSLGHLPAAQIVEHFATRMQIEEALRDLKSARYGLGFELNLSRSSERLAALLLIAMLSFFVLWLIGRHALAHKLQFHYESNTRRARPVHSLFNLACLIVRRAIDQQLACDFPRLPLPVRSPLPLARGI